MAVIEKIRNKQGLLVVLIGLAMLLFVVDADSLKRMFTGQGGEKPLGQLNGVDILDSQINFTETVNNQTAQRRNMAIQQGQQLSEDQVRSLENDIWNGVVADTLFNTAIRSIGLYVSDKELNDGILNTSKPIESQLSRQFLDQNQNLMVDSFANSITRMISSYNSQEGGATQLYYNIELPLKLERQRGKYQKMVESGLVATSEEATRKAYADNSNATISYVFKEFSSIPDSSVVVTDADIKAYYDEHKYEKKWTNEVTARSFKYVRIPILPQERDFTKAKEALERKRDGFASSNNDTLYIQNNSSTKAFTMNPQYGQMVPTGMLATEPYEAGDILELDKSILTGNKGDVFGPIVVNRSAQLVKIRDVATRYETTVRHILIGTIKDQRSRTKYDDAEVAIRKKRADSIANVVRADSSKFSDLVTEFSDDPGSKMTGGKYTFDKDKAFVQEFKDFGFDKPVGHIGVVETEHGYHVMQVLNRGDIERRWISKIDKQIKISEKTQKEANMNKMLPLRDTILEKGFQTATEEMGYGATEAQNVRIDNPVIPGIGYNLDILQWAFNSPLRSVSEANYVSTPNGVNLVLCYLTEIMDEGESSFEAVKERMAIEVYKEKKAEMLKDAIGGQKDLAVAEKVFGIKAVPSQVSLSSNAISGKENLGNEPGLIGEIFTTAAGEISDPIITQRGVYVFKVDNKVMGSTEADQIMKERADLTEKMKQQASITGILDALKESADFKDYRMKKKIMN